MFPEDIKKFVIDSNKEKVVLKDFEVRRNQDIKTKVVGGSTGPSGSTSYGTATGTNNRAIVAANQNKNLASITTLQSGQQQTIGHLTASTGGLAQPADQMGAG